MWSLQLTPGSSTNIYTIVGSSGLGGEPVTGAALAQQWGAGETHVPVVVSSFEGAGDGGGAYMGWVVRVGGILGVGDEEVCCTWDILLVW